MSDVCLTLLGSPEVEEKLLDHLLMSPFANTFTSQPAASHGGHLSGLDPREAVLGRSDAVLIQVLVGADEAQRLVDDLRQSIKGAGVRYWLTPVLAQGEL